MARYVPPSEALRVFVARIGVVAGIVRAGAIGKHDAGFAVIVRVVERVGGACEWASWGRTVGTGEMAGEGRDFEGLSDSGPDEDGERDGLHLGVLE